MYIFNSLGSNYSYNFVLHSLRFLLHIPDKEVITQSLTAEIKKLYPAFENNPYYFYKGRDAIEFALKAHSIGKEATVLMQAFTCHAIEAAVRRSGAVPGFVDLAPNSFNPSLQEFEAALKKYPQTKAVLVQHTLGVPAEIEEIRRFCSKNSLLLIEDLAQSMGATDEAGKLLGSFADVVIFSFGRDKILDAVTGGACLIRKKTPNTQTQNFTISTNKIFVSDLFYPLLTFCIRKTYRYLVGVIILYLAKILGLLQSPVKARFEFITALPTSSAALAVDQFLMIDEQLAHRRKIAKIYQTKLAQFSLTSLTQIEHSSNLRFSLVVPDPSKLSKYMARSHIYIGDRWYRGAVDSGSLQYLTKYKAGSCPNAEKLAAHIVNLPTHQNVTELDALSIAALVENFLKEPI